MRWNETAPSQGRVAIVTALGLLGIAIFLYMIFSSGGHQISGTPHPDDDKIPFIVGIAFGLTAFGVIISSTPRGFRTFCSAFMAFLFLSIIWGFSSGIALLNYRENSDFTGNSGKEGFAELPIRSAESFHSRGMKYQVWLKGYNTTEAISEHDYLQTFGDVAQANPQGYCLRAMVQVNGSAVRIMSFGELPTGSVIRCSKPA